VENGPNIFQMLLVNKSMYSLISDIYCAFYQHAPKCFDEQNATNYDVRLSWTFCLDVIPVAIVT